MPRAQLAAALPELARATGLELRPFSEMSLDELAALTGLSREQAARAQERAFDEPFLVAGPRTTLPGSRDPRSTPVSTPRPDASVCASSTAVGCTT